MWRSGFVFLLLLGLLGWGSAARMFRPWNEKHWCQSVVDPWWPTAFAKQSGDSVELKGRTASSLMNPGHICGARGSESKCHRCEDIPCGPSLDQTCAFQLQGADWSELNGNVATVTDVPWAVGGTHRNDFGGSDTTHTCLMLSGGACVEPFGEVGFHYGDSCVTRCWGHNNGLGVRQQTPTELRSQTPDYFNNPEERLHTVVWEYDPYEAGQHSQGYVEAFAGVAGVAGHQDGPSHTALFDSPRASAVDAMRNVFVADTGNHVIRRIDAVTKEVTTVAGIPGQAGDRTGTGDQALLNTPSGVSLYYDWGVKRDAETGLAISTGTGRLVLVVSDTGNHRLRRITFDDDTNIVASGARVSTLTGRKNLNAQAGFADGDATETRMNTPLGLAADESGVVFFTDSGNHVIRRVHPDGQVFTLAGTLEQVDDTRCDLPPCLKGVAGVQDGPLLEAMFNFPSDITIGLESTLYVTDGHRVRRLLRNDTTAVIQGVERTSWVSTIAGQLEDGEQDGLGNETRFNEPRGIVMAADSRVYVADTGSCRVRRLSSADLTSMSVECSASLLHLLSPAGCTSYEPGVDSLELKLSAKNGNLEYNRQKRGNRVFRNKWDLVEESGDSAVGKKWYRCQGSPPRVAGFQSNGATVSAKGGTGFAAFSELEDTDVGTTILVSCPAFCAATGAVFGTDVYSDDSNVCEAAVHAGVLDNLVGGLVSVCVTPEVLADLPGELRNGVPSQTRTGGWHRTFEFCDAAQVANLHVDTIAGFPAAPLEDQCGNVDQDKTLPRSTKLAQNHGVAMFVNASLTDTERLYITDTGNHMIRTMSATCTKICENGGKCSAPDLCACEAGWAGDDCTLPVCSSGLCGEREVCVAPNTCACVPGFSNQPACTTPLCVQTCENGGACVAPDTCGCASGWFDTNCTTPVCSQTCGNGGNCTAPDTCNCPSDWTGADCRTPVCRQTCGNGGTCVAPDTCNCPPSWSGHDCSLPVCRQGYLEQDPSPYYLSEETRAQRVLDHQQRTALLNVTPDEASGRVWRQYVACDPDQWCNATNGFDCLQPVRDFGNLDLNVDAGRGMDYRGATGFHHLFNNRNQTQTQANCVRLELQIDERTPFPYEFNDENDRTTPLWRYPPSTPYEWDTWATGPDVILNTSGVYLEMNNQTKDLPFELFGWRSASPSSADRMVAHAQWRLVPQGVYVCANGGNCTAPDTCKCAPGWIGFDCRTPICSQGFYEPNEAGQVRFETIDLATLQPLDFLVSEKFEGQGLYECSERAWTEWENPFFLHEHPNYYSMYMDDHAQKWSSETRYQVYPEDPYYFDDMGFPALYEHGEPDGNHTNKGWTRNGVWSRTDKVWTKGQCVVKYRRSCEEDPLKAFDLVSNALTVDVLDTDASYRMQVTYTDEKESGPGRWFQQGGDCLDQVLRGCFNNGTCVAPDTCECAEGWSGPDCSKPVCEQPCSRPLDEDLGLDSNGFKIFSRGTGNCTHPNTCTCEKGWTGNSCEIPLCAQECNHGKCTAPDTCTCDRWESQFVDSTTGVVPKYQVESGEAQLSGWTGYDCNTPICTMAKSFVPNDLIGSSSLGGYQLILYGDEPFNNILRPDLKQPPYLPYRMSGNEVPQKRVYLVDEMRGYNEEKWSQNPHWLEWEYRLCRMLMFQYCTDYPGASPFGTKWGPGDGEVVRNDGRSFQSGCKHDSERFSDLDGTSEGYLCNVIEWNQGDYAEGRYVRLSEDATMYDFTINEDNEQLRIFNKKQGVIPSEGVYECQNRGACVAPDTCTCPDGYDGLDCSNPLCRHVQADGSLVSCVNGGQCLSKDICTCVTQESTLFDTYAWVPPGTTGFNGSDCSIPMCMQGTFDPDCTGVTPGGEGCFRCLNGGNCTAPDFCTCPPEWTGIDCGTPVCTVIADEQIIFELDTGDVNVIRDFELDPCQHEKKTLHQGRDAHQGNCTAPGICTCFCSQRSYFDDDGYLVPEEPWIDFPLARGLPVGFVHGTKECVAGFEGTLDKDGMFMTCHLTIYQPSFFERYTILLLALMGFLCCIAFGVYLWIRRKVRQLYLIAKAERRLQYDSDDDVDEPLVKDG